MAPKLHHLPFGQLFQNQLYNESQIVTVNNIPIILVHTSELDTSYLYGKRGNLDPLGDLKSASYTLIIYG